MGHGARTHTTSKDGKVDNGRVVDAGALDGVVPLLLERSAADEERDSARPHETIDGEDADPDHDLVPPLHGQAQQRHAEGRLCHGDADDAEELPHEEELVGLRKKGEVHNLEDVRAQAVLRCKTFQCDRGYQTGLHQECCQHLVRMALSKSRGDGVPTQAKATSPSSMPIPFEYRSLQKKRNIMQTKARPATAAVDLISSLALFSPVGGGGAAAGTGESAMPDTEEQKWNNTNGEFSSQSRAGDHDVRRALISLSSRVTRNNGDPRTWRDDVEMTPGPRGATWYLPVDHARGSGQTHHHGLDGLQHLTSFNRQVRNLRWLGGFLAYSA